MKISNIKFIMSNMNILQFSAKNNYNQTKGEILMSEYNLDIFGDIKLSDYSRIYDYMGVVDVEDKFTITFNERNKNNLDILCSMLESNNFIFRTEGGKNGEKKYIRASRIR